MVDLPGAREQLQYLFPLTSETTIWPRARLRQRASWEALPTGKPARLPAQDAHLCGGCGRDLCRWYSSQRFCGRCGARMGKARSSGQWSARACGNTVYPKICPAVIVAVHDGERLLLTRYKDRPIKHYALVAGFNEIGESIEETVHREVL